MPLENTMHGAARCRAADSSSCKEPSTRLSTTYWGRATRLVARRRRGGQSIRAGPSRQMLEKRRAQPKRRWKAPCASWLGIAREFCLMQGTLNTPLRNFLALSHPISCPAPARGAEYSRGVQLAEFEANGRFVTTRPDPRGKLRNGAARNVRTGGSSRYTPLGPSPRGIFGSGPRRRRLPPAPRGLQRRDMTGFQPGVFTLLLAVGVPPRACHAPTEFGPLSRPKPRIHPFPPRFKSHFCTERFW